MAVDSLIGPVSSSSMKRTPQVRIAQLDYWKLNLQESDYARVEINLRAHAAALFPDRLVEPGHNRFCAVKFEYHRIKDHRLRFSERIAAVFAEEPPKVPSNPLKLVVESGTCSATSHPVGNVIRAVTAVIVASVESLRNSHMSHQMAFVHKFAANITRNMGFPARIEALKLRMLQQQTVYDQTTYKPYGAHSKKAIIWLIWLLRKQVNICHRCSRHQFLMLPAAAAQ
ncbi:hypothetical protein K438DRAFT_1776713 [Mycena galopus ATCC 62051]|nr:hypothetical protein K438DRAFT_1776713 [Mycena galopus ATCC 62051]